MTLDTEDLDDRQLQLLDLLTREFDSAPSLDPVSGAALYQTLRRHLTSEGATEGDFEFLTGELARLIIETANPFTPRQKSAQLSLISKLFALRDFHLVVDRGLLVSLAFADRSTRH